MEKERNSNIWLIMAFILVFLVAVLGIIGTIYFYNKSLDNNVEDKTNVEDNNNVNDESLKFTLLEEYVLTENDSKDVIVGNKTLKFKTINNQLYFNDKKIDFEFPINQFYVTNLIVLFSPGAGQFGEEFIVYDLDGNKITNFDRRYQFRDLKISDDGKLLVNVFDINTQWMEGYRIGNLTTEPEGWGDCTKKLKDYPEIIEEHKDDILSADYYFEYSNHELLLKVLKVKLTVGDLELDTCVYEN